MFIWHSLWRSIRNNCFACSDLLMTIEFKTDLFRLSRREHDLTLILELPSTDVYRIIRRMMDNGPLISVVVPAFNAAQTIRETLHSISVQTYRKLEVIVVDDGSTDDTATLVRNHARNDPRFRVISQANGGVASARNAGVRASSGELIAFIDADDLWHPSKIEKQAAVLSSGGPDMGLVYCPFRLIDIDGMVRASPRRYAISGWVLHRHFHTNLVGNGSAILIRKSVFEEVDGFDPSLRAQGAEGCEDLLLQLRVAARYRFGEVFQYLVGYRRHPRGMSENADQMTRSGILAVRRALAENSHVPHLSAGAMLRRYEWKRLKHMLKQRHFMAALRDIVFLFRSHPGFVAGAIWADLIAQWKKLFGAIMEQAQRLQWRPGGALRHFYDFEPADIVPADSDGMPADLRQLSQWDQGYRPRARQAIAASAKTSSVIPPTQPPSAYQRGLVYSRRQEEG
jgi:glycosyltransferase involved in cell wall biosynthesis